jgi:hypothetical protein
MGNLPALLPNATPLLSRFFAQMLKKRQRYALVNLENNFLISAKFTDVYCNCKQQLGQKTLCWNGLHFVCPITTKKKKQNKHILYVAVHS